MSSRAPLQVLAARWADARANERGNFQTYLIELCEALGVERPGPSGSGFEFELPIKVITKEGEQVPNFIDCWRRDFFAIEAKDDETGRSREQLMRRAFGQVRNYVTYAPGGMPPYIMVMDVARLLLVWNRWTGNYGDWQASKRIDLTRLAEHPEDVDLLRAIWTDPASLDPRARAQAVTKEVAGYLANLARKLETTYEQERVARFVMRCVFTMFAEDIGLLDNEPFRHMLERCKAEPEAFAEQAQALWKAMDAGEKFDFRRIMRFNGHFFRNSEALPLDKDAILILLLAAEADWQDVEPAIFGTLLTRALDPKERHRLGAEFTPRKFVERVVRPTVEEPIRERWVAVQAEVLQLKEGGKRGRARAEERLREFHAWLKSLRFLDPACGSGNFLYVTMHIVKLIELELLKELDDVTRTHEMLFDEVHPKQFFGIELKLWAREIAEMVLWIGYHQFWKAHHDRAPKEPVLQDTGTIECRDAVLAWEELRHDPDRDRPDPTPRIKHPISGKLVPDPLVKLQYMQHANPHPASWPEAHFIVGNPPYLGKSRKRHDLGDGYVDALQVAYPDVPPAADYVMYWWYRAAEEVSAGRAIRAGLITTNSIVQRQSREVIDNWSREGVRVAWAIPDHPWVDDEDGAAVRVAITVLAKDAPYAQLLEVDETGRVITETRAARLNADLSAGVDIASAAAKPLLANKGLATVGFKLYGEGFVVTKDEATRLLKNKAHSLVLRPLFIGRDLAARPKGDWVIDFGHRTEDEAATFPALFDIVRSRVKPHRDANSNEDIKSRWWQLGHLRDQLRESAQGINRLIATPETARHRFFVFLDTYAAPEGSIFCISSDDAFVIGCLSSSIHTTWAEATAGKLGVGNDYRYNKYCFDSFPFPQASAGIVDAIRTCGERLDEHRRSALEAHEALTMTGMYNVVDKLRSGEALSEEDRATFEQGACGVLRDIHDELDELVARAYEWKWPLARTDTLRALVQLHDERVALENSGTVYWLRPDYQAPRFGKDLGRTIELAIPAPAKAIKAQTLPWPASAVEQIQALKSVLSERTLGQGDLVALFRGSKGNLIERHLDILQLMGEIHRTKDGRYHSAPASGTVA